MSVTLKFRMSLHETSQSKRRVPNTRMCTQSSRGKSITFPTMTHCPPPAVFFVLPALVPRPHAPASPFSFYPPVVSVDVPLPQHDYAIVHLPLPWNAHCATVVWTPAVLPPPPNNASLSPPPTAFSILPPGFSAVFLLPCHGMRLLHSLLLLQFPFILLIHGGVEEEHTPLLSVVLYCGQSTS